MPTQRIEWLDSYKGILISFIVFIHIIDLFPIYEPVMKLFAGMRMPAFFFISGFLLSRKYTDFALYFSHRFRQLILPYFVFFILTVVFWKIFELATHYNMFSSIDLIKGMIYGVPSSNLMFTAAPLWFVLALFLAGLYYFLLVVFIKDDRLKLFFLLCYAGIGYLLGHYLSWRLPWNADTAFMGAFFFGLGNLSKKYLILEKIHLDNIYVKYLLIFILLGISAYLSFHSINEYARARFDNLVYTIVSAITGILALIYLSSFKTIADNSTLQGLGRHSYIILAFHNIPVYITQRALDKLTHSKILFPDNALMQGLLALPYLAFILLLMCPMIYLINTKTSLLVHK